jgi:hypothetical protein
MLFQYLSFLSAGNNIEILCLSYSLYEIKRFHVCLKTLLFRRFVKLCYIMHAKFYTIFNVFKLLNLKSL